MMSPVGDQREVEELAGPILIVRMLRLGKDCMAK